MKQEGADVIIAIAHSGIENGEQAAGAETPYTTWLSRRKE